MTGLGGWEVGLEGSRAGSFVGGWLDVCNTSDDRKALSPVFLTGCLDVEPDKPGVLA